MELFIEAVVGIAKLLLVLVVVPMVALDLLENGAYREIRDEE